MSRFGFEPVDLIAHADAAIAPIAIIGYCPTDAEAWGADVLVYLPTSKQALAVGSDLVFTPEEIEEIGLVYQDLVK